MLNKINSLLLKFNEQILFAKNENQTNLITSINSIGIYRRASILMASYEKQIQFTDVAKEIDFYKHTKPTFLSNYFFFDYILNLEKLKSCLKNSDSKLQFLILKRCELLQFDILNADFIVYLKSNLREDDNFYFTSKNCSKCLYDENLWLELLEAQDPKFDILKAQHLANDQLHIYFIEEIKKQEINEYVQKNEILHWNGKPVELVELIYALYALGKIGNKDSKIADLVDNFSKLFGTKISNYSKIFDDIQSRSKSPTRLLDKLSKALLSYIDSLPK